MDSIKSSRRLRALLFLFVESHFYPSSEHKATHLICSGVPLKVIELPVIGGTRQRPSLTNWGSPSLIHIGASLVIFASLRLYLLFPVSMHSSHKDSGKFQAHGRTTDCPTSTSTNMSTVASWKVVSEKVLAQPKVHCPCHLSSKWIILLRLQEHTLLQSSAMRLLPM